MKPRVSSRERAVVAAAASRLLRYPDDGLLAELPLLLEAADRLPAAFGGPLRELIAHLDGTPLLMLQADYVATFDLRRRNSLYLTYFLNGDTRRRGQAIWRFQDLIRRRGYAVADGELADFLPAVLELIAEFPDDPEPLELLLEHQAGISVLLRSLQDDRSPWTGAVLALDLALPRPSRAVAEAAERILAEGPPAEQVGLDPFSLDPFVRPGATGGQP